MSRPKKDTEAGQKANAKWRETVTKKYGSPTEMMREIGRVGGLAGRGEGYTGGFAGNRGLAKIAGSKGGSISKRKSRYYRELVANEEYIKNNMHLTVKEIASNIGVPCNAVYHHIRKMYKKK